MVTNSNEANDEIQQMAEIEAMWANAESGKKRKKGKAPKENSLNHSEINNAPNVIGSEVSIEKLEVQSKTKEENSRKKNRKNKKDNIENILAQNFTDEITNANGNRPNDSNEAKKSNDNNSKLNLKIDEKPKQSTPAGKSKNLSLGASNEKISPKNQKPPQAASKPAPKSKAALKMLERLAKENEKKEKQRMEEEENQRKLKELEEERIRKEQEEKKRKEEQKLKDKAAKKEQKVIDAENKIKERQNRLMQGKTIIANSEPKKNQIVEHDDSEIYTNKQIAEISGLPIDDKLRSPIVCILGHVDTGKTKILDQLRCSKVQDHEAGGITQQIGATNVSAINIQNSIKNTAFGKKKLLKLPGILLIDTPGHESFHNLRVRGTSLCDICVLVVDVTHGLEPQTIESIKILKESKTKFIVALNKVDKIHGWKSFLDLEIQESIKKQDNAVKSDFDDQFSKVFLQFAEQNINIALFYDYQTLKQGTDIVPVVPTSAHSGEGIPDLMSLVCLVCQTVLKNQLLFKNELSGHLMEAKHIQGYGMTLDTILVNGELKEGDTIILVDNFKPVVNKIKFILVPPTMAEMRVKVALKSVRSIKGSRGIKLTLQNSEHSSNIMIGIPLLAATNPTEEEINEMMQKVNIKDQLSRLSGFSEIGVHVQSSTMGSLEAILKDLKSRKIPYSSASLGDIHKKDILKASTMVEKSPMHAIILAFNVKIEKEILEIAKNLGVKILNHEIVYHLYDQYKKHVDEYLIKYQKEFYDKAIFPCTIKILPQCVYYMKNPLICGVIVEEGEIRLSTRIRVFTDKGNFHLGKIISIEKEKKSLQAAYKGDEVSVQIKLPDGQASTQKLYGRHYDHNSLLISDLTRESIDILKDYFRDEVSKKKLWGLVKKHKEKLEIT